MLNPPQLAPFLCRTVLYFKPLLSDCATHPISVRIKHFVCICNPFLHIAIGENRNPDQPVNYQLGLALVSFPYNGSPGPPAGGDVGSCEFWEKF